MLGYILNIKNEKVKKIGKNGFFGKISFFGGPPAPSFMGNFQIFFKKVQCRFPGYLVLKFCNKLTDSSPDHSAHLFLNHFGPLDRGGKKKFLRNAFLQKQTYLNLVTLSPAVYEISTKNER